jgi:hypothetical protein
VLSDERRLSRWAYVDQTTRAMTEPSTGSKKVKTLTRWTADGTPELVLVLAQRTLRDGSVWALVRLPMRPNGKVGWVNRDHLSGYRKVTTALDVDKRRKRATLFRDGKKIWQASIGIGKRRSPTPVGNYYVRERLVPTNKKGIYGVFAFGISAYSPTLTDWPGGGVIGIHGTNQPRLIPGVISNGCVRVRNANIARLKKLMPLGTPVRIR